MGYAQKALVSVNNPVCTPVLQAVQSKLIISKLKGEPPGAIKIYIGNITFVQKNSGKMEVSITFDAPLEAELKELTKHIFCVGNS